ncbi:MAG: hypothetical protein KC983_04740 [Phycisphaerales bacterium]|nr:hypothetical protein [Phycisphaerales bacterium]
MSDDRAFITQFEAQQWPLERWHHRDHIRLAYLYLRAYPFDEALRRIRHGIRAHNEAHGIPDLPTSGYHDTVTVAWLHLVAAMLEEYGPEDTGDEFCDAHPELMNKKTLRLFYSRDRLMSAEAKRMFVTPNLAPLPASRATASGRGPEMEKGEDARGCASPPIHDDS